MKITDLKVYLTRPKSSTRSWLFVEIDTDEGITGTCLLYTSDAEDDS